MNSIEDHPQSASCKLADYLEANQEELIIGWVAQVRRASDIPTESLTKPEIIDHVPKIFEAVLHALRQQYGEKTMAKVQVVTARHTIVRWVQGYDLDAVLREASLLRGVFMDSARTFGDKTELFSGGERDLAYTTINRILMTQLRMRKKPFSNSERELTEMWPNNSFKPKLLRYIKSVA